MPPLQLVLVRLLVLAVVRWLLVLVLVLGGLAVFGLAGAWLAVLDGPP